MTKMHAQNPPKLCALMAGIVRSAPTPTVVVISVRMLIAIVNQVAIAYRKEKGPK